MNHRLELELMLRRHGWRLALAVLLPILAGIALLVWLAPPATPPVLVAATDGSRQLEAHHRAFRAVLIPQGDIETRQGEILEAALRHGLAVGQLDYGFENRAAGQYGVASLLLPLRGSYADLRAFLAGILAAQPGLAIEDLAIQRESTGSAVAARLKLALFTVAAEPGP